MILDSSYYIKLLKDPTIIDDDPDFYAKFESESWIMNTVQVAEIAQWAIDFGWDPDLVISDAKKEIHFYPLTETLAIKGAKIKKDMRNQGASKFSLIDGIILATARETKHKLITYDSDFELAKEAIVLSH